MPKYRKDIKEDLQRNRPNLALSIFTSLISLVIIIFVIFLGVTKLISVGLCIFTIVIFLLLTLATWFGMYLAKKQKTMTLKEIEKETYQFADFVKTKKYYKTYSTGKDLKLIANIVSDKASYIPYTIDKNTLKLGSLNSTNTFISFGIGMGGVEVDENGDIIAIKGMLVKSIWLKKKLTLPPYKSGSVNISCDNFKLTGSTHIQELPSEDTYYDKKLGYICIGERKHYEIDEPIEITNGFIIVVRENQIVSVWIKVGTDIKID